MNAFVSSIIALSKHVFLFPSASLRLTTIEPYLIFALLENWVALFRSLPVPWAKTHNGDACRGDEKHRKCAFWFANSRTRGILTLLSCSEQLVSLLINL